MNNKPNGYRNAIFSPETPGKSVNESKLADLKTGSETRSKRVQILIPPQMHNKLKEISESTGASINEIINKSIEQYITDL